MNKYIRNTIVGVASSVIAAIILAVSWPNVFKSFIEFIVCALSLNIKLWWILVFVAIVISVFVLILWIENRNGKGVNMEFMKITSDTIHGVRWRWRWVIGSDNMYRITDFHAFCIVDDTMLMRCRGAFSQISHKCPRCDREYTVDEDVCLTLAYDNVRKQTENPS